MYNDLVLMDLDGVMFDLSHRLPLIEGNPKQWGAFYEACDLDLPYPQAQAFVDEVLAQGGEIRFMTGRPERVREKTIASLIKHYPFDEDYFVQTDAGIDDNLLMRPDKKPFTFMKGSALKERWLKAMTVFDRARIVGACDDDKAIIDMYRKHNVPAVLVENGVFYPDVV